MLEHLLSIIALGGALGVGFLMFAETVFPPLPSEVIMPLAGFLAARGDFGFWPVIAAGSIGAMAGAQFWRLIGRWVGPDRRWADWSPQCGPTYPSPRA